MFLLTIINLLHFFSAELLSVFDIDHLIQYGGLLFIFFVVYAQTGLFFCFFVPSGALLFTSGMYLATGKLQHNIFLFCACLIIASFLGCCTGFSFGRKTGPFLYQKEDSKFFHKNHLRAAE